MKNYFMLVALLASVAFSVTATKALAQDNVNEEVISKSSDEPFAKAQDEEDATSSEYMHGFPGHGGGGGAPGGGGHGGGGFPGHGGGGGAPGGGHGPQPGPGHGGGGGFPGHGGPQPGPHPMPPPHGPGPHPMPPPHGPVGPGPGHGGPGGHPGGGFHHAPYPGHHGGYPWRHWGHPFFPRPHYVWNWGALRVVTCTAVDSRGEYYPVTEDGYYGIEYQTHVDEIEDAAIDRCYDETNGDTSCSLVGCEAGY